MKLFFNWWSHLRVSKKLYVVVGIMATLIASELFTLYFAMNTLSAVRGLVGGEGLWSKAQKNAIYNLQRYATTHDEKYYELFRENLKVPLGDHRARLEIEKPEMDMKKVTVDLLEGQNSPEDTESMVHLIRRFHNVSYMKSAIEQWQQADVMIEQLVTDADKLHHLIKERNSGPEIDRLFDQITQLDDKLTKVEIEFSSGLGVASRWLEHLLRIGLLLAVIGIESIGLALTISFARKLTKILREMNDVTQQIGKGNFSQQVPVRSSDELGELADSINLMTGNLQRQILERENAEQASEAKNLFLANMSHEMRTPLNAILGFSELLASPDLTEKQREEYQSIVKRTGAALTSIINDILDIAKIEARQIQVSQTNFQLIQLISDVKSLLSVRCFEKGIQLYIIRKGDIADVIRSDPARLRQILINLIGNSIKFTQQGSVTVSYEVIGSQLVFTVKDTGVGIPEEHRGRLFKPFSQGDDSVRKKYGGTGLGLMISQRMAHLLGGDVYLAESKPGQGSTFVAKIDYQPVSEQTRTESLPPLEETKLPLEKFHAKKILVVEDTVDNQTLVRLYLAKTDALVDFVSNGRDGVSRALGNSYDLILMDMQMPVMDGYSATQKLRQQGCRIPIIAMTGYAMKQDKEKCLEVGCNDYIAKPFDRQTLLVCLAKYL
jgi:signal transduction histidine kinase